MADIVTFDPVNLRIIEIDAGGDNELNVIEIYSEWKVWVTSDPQNAGYPHAFEVIGGDPISGTLNLGTTFFLANGWKIRPAESNHRLTLIGNLWTRDGLDPIVDTIGTYRVTARQQVSNLVDSSVARLDLDQLLASVYIDVDRGVAGTGEGIGTPTNPVNNIADAYLIATSKKLRSYTITGSLTLDQNYDHWTFTGLSAHTDLSHALNINGYTVDQCVFNDLNMLGTMAGIVQARRCGLGVISGLDGHFTDCGLFSDVTLDDACFATFINCFSMVPGTARPNLYFGTNSQAQLRNWDGGIELRTMTAGCVVSVDLDTGRCGVNADCSGGSLTLRGTGDLVDNSAGAVTLDTGGFLSTNSIATEVHARGKLARRLNMAEEAAGVLREIE